MIAFARSLSRPVRQTSVVLAAGILALSLHGTAPAQAQDAKDAPKEAPAAPKPAPDTVLAKVNGAEIRQSDLDMAEQEAASPELDQMDPASKHEAILGSLINMKLVVKAAEDKKLADTPDFKRKLAFVRDRLLMDAVLADQAKTAVTDSALHAVYDDATKQMSGDIEVHARHILVDSEDEAKKIAEEARKPGADFAELAKKNSKDPGAADGGDLGFFTKDQMVPEFSEAAFKLEPGQISDPVKTQFGWHVIKVEEKRARKPPEFDQVKSQLESFVVRKAQADYIDGLRQNAKIERLDQPAPAAQTPDAKAPDAPAAPAKKK
jgi:peptidyl-prolyl cis-trans isomerase C